jgi:hypothetical protein
MDFFTALNIAINSVKKNTNQNSFVHGDTNNIFKKNGKISNVFEGNPEN